jgi:Clp amino terminal domain, pathogenicity island component
MFDRYTENARRTIFFARYEALEAGCNTIGTEHIGLGLLRDQWLVATVLCGHDAGELKSALLSALTQGKGRTPGEDIPLNGEAKRVLAYAADAADTLFDFHIGNEHLLLGAVRHTRSTAGRALKQEGIEAEGLRKNIKGISREIRKAYGGDQAARWRAAGIPEGYSGPTLLYNAASETAIVEVRTASETHRPLTRLLMRGKGSDVYEPIGDPAEDVSYESPVTCEKFPILVFNSLKHTKTGGAHWVGIYIFDLAKRELNLCVSKETFKPPTPYTGGWIAQILSLSTDAGYAFVKTGLERPPEQHGAETRINLDYYVGRLNLSSKELELITHLKNIFF